MFGFDGPVLIVFLIGIIVYFIPTFVARSRNHYQKTAITVLNIVAGWTFLGWVGALVWAFLKTGGGNEVQRQADNLERAS